MFCFSLLVLTGCKEDFVDNPFDDEFDVSVKSLIQNGCDTVPAGCGYFNLMDGSIGTCIYYQVYFDDFYDVVAKGFEFHLDTIEVMNYPENYDAVMDSIMGLSIEVDKLNGVIMEYDYVYLDMVKDGLRIVNKNIHDTIFLTFRIFEGEEEGLLVRNIEYFYGKY